MAGRADLRPQVLLHKSSLRIPHGDSVSARPSIGAYGAEAPDIKERGREAPLTHGETDAWQKNAVEKTLQNCRKTIVLDRRD
jgi:hypothetical protein